MSSATFNGEAGHTLIVLFEFDKVHRTALRHVASSMEKWNHPEVHVLYVDTPSGESSPSTSDLGRALQYDVSETLEGITTKLPRVHVAGGLYHQEVVRAVRQHKATHVVAPSALMSTHQHRFTNLKQHVESSTDAHVVVIAANDNSGDTYHPEERDSRPANTDPDRTAERGHLEKLMSNLGRLMQSPSPKLTPS